MAEFVVLQGWSGQVGNNQLRFAAGDVIDDAIFDINELRGGGCALLAGGTPEVNEALRQFRGARDANSAADLLALLQSTGALAPSGAIVLGGDLSGSPASASVIRLRGRDVASTAPTDNQVLTWDNAQAEWVPEDPQGAGSQTLAGDVTGDSGSNTVERIRGRIVNPTAPSAGEVLTWDGTGNEWDGEPITTAPAGRFLQADAVGRPVTTSLREESDRLVSDKSIEAPAGSVFLGPAVRLSALGEQLSVSDMARSVKTIVTSQSFDDSGSQRPETLALGAVQVLSEQAINTNTQSAAVHEFVINDPTAPAEAIAASFEIDLATIPSGEIVLAVWLGTSATGARLLEMRSLTPTTGVNTLTTDAPITLQGNTNYFLRLSADDSFDLRGVNVPPFVLFFRLRGQVITRSDLATVAEANDALELQGRDVAATAPTDGQVLVWNNSASQWEPQTLQLPPSGLTPILTNYHTTAPSRVDISTDLTGQNYNATYDIQNAASVVTARIVGFPTGSPGSAVSIIADASRQEGGNSQAFAFPSGVDFGTEGNSYTLRLELYMAGQTVGVDTPEQSADQTIVAQAAQRNDLLYYGISTDNTPANVDVSTLQSQTRLDGDVTLPTWSDSQYVIFAYPDSAPAVTQLLIGNVNQLAAFTLTASAITVNTVAYSTLISDNQILGSVASGTIATIVR